MGKLVNDENTCTTAIEKFCPLTKSSATDRFQTESSRRSSGGFKLLVLPMPVASDSFAVPKFSILQCL